MSTPRRLIRHLSGWKRGDAIPAPIQRTDRGPTKPRFTAPPPRRRNEPQEDLAATIAANRERRLRETNAPHLQKPAARRP